MCRVSVIDCILPQYFLLFQGNTYVAGFLFDIPLFYKMSSYKSRRYYGSKRESKRAKTSAETIVSKGLQGNAVRQQLEKIILAKSETKFVTNANIGFSMAPLGQTVALSTIAQGTNFNQRIGNHVTSKYVHFRICVQIGAAATGTSADCCYRFSVVLDKQPNGALATFGTIWDTAVADGALALRNAAQYGDRFRVLKEVHGTINYNGNSVSFHDEYINLEMLDEKFRRAEFLSSGATVGDWSSNQILFAFACGDAGAGPTPVPTISYNVRYAYKDT